ncbi:MAG: molybdopterin-dependent oxidoreductase, partial [bacterium]|nr:molybdopterin-dependent oxidoreductase [bacterium]
QRGKSVCGGCARGCNTVVDHRSGQVYRMLPRENEQVNKSWMCDEGRLTYKPVNESNRLRLPMVKDGGAFREQRAAETLRQIREKLVSMDPNLICGIGSAQYTNEDNFAFKQFLTTLGVSHFYRYHHRPVHPSSDNFLIKADKNPNSRGVETLGFQEVTGDRRFQFFFVLGPVEEDFIKPLFLEKEATVVLFSPWKTGAGFSNFLLPVGTFAETEGTFTNFQGRVQRIRAAFPPPGESRPVWQWCHELTRLLEKPEPLYDNAEKLFSRLAMEVPAFKGLSYEKMGNQGALLK